MIKKNSKEVSENIPNKNNKKSKLRENIEVIFSAIGIALLIRIFVIEAYSIPSGSMIPNLLHGDRLIVNKFTFGVRIPILGWKLPSFTKPTRGDMVVFQTPTYKSVGSFRQLVNLVTFGIFGLDNTSNNPRIFVKRAIGVPGDIITFDMVRKYEKRFFRNKNVFYHKIVVNGNEFKREFVMPAIPQKISAVTFEDEILKKLINLDLKEFLKIIYKLNDSRNFYVLKKELNSRERKKAYRAFVEANYTLRYYRGTSPLDVYIENNGIKKYKVQYFARQSLIKGTFYIPRENDVVTLKLLSKKKNENFSTGTDIYISGKILMTINGKHTFKISGGLFETVYNNIYQNVFPKNVIKTLSRKRVVNYRFKNNYYFMMGDNRDDSSDSRIWGLLNEDNIIGTPVLIYFPFSRFSIAD